MCTGISGTREFFDVVPKNGSSVLSLMYIGFKSTTMWYRERFNLILSLKYFGCKMGYLSNICSILYVFPIKLMYFA